MQEMSRDVQEAADSARAAAAEYEAVVQEASDSARAAEAGGRLPPQEVTVAAVICNICDEEATGDCKKGNCVSCCESSRGTGVFQCCDGGYGSSGEESAAEAWEVPSQDSSPPALALQELQAADVEQAVVVEQATDVEQASKVEQMYLEIQQITQHSGSGRRQTVPPAAENSRQHHRQPAAATATVGRGQQMAS